MTINPMVDMASFTPFDLPADKEDIFWDDSITKGSTDFFDQFVVLDDCNTDWTSGGEFGYSSLGKDATSQDIFPPTSIGPLSVSSTASADLPCTASSSHSHTGPVGTPGGAHQQPYHGGGSTLNVGHEASHPETIEQRHLQFSGRKLPVGGSISDAELLKLEGLSMRSPIRAVRPPIPETFLPPSPPLQPSTTARPHTTDAKKRSRLESIYATIRKAAHIRTRPRVDQQSVPIPQTVMPAHLGSPPKRTHRRLKSENMTATQSRNFPLSPPMSNPMPDLPQHLKAEPGFVAGFLDDPFFEPNGHLAPPAQINGAAMPHTPLDTPQMEGNNRHAVGIAPTSLALDSHGIPTTAWPLTTTTMAEVTTIDWPSATYVTASGDDGHWWEGSGSHDIDMAGGHDYQANARNASMNLNLQLQPYEFHNSGIDDMSNGGLMIHMPQPRTPNTAPLLARDVTVPPPPPPADHAPPMPSPTRGYHTEHRRPKPRAPSTGARHGLALTSPRKRHTSQSSSSSTSPTPGAGAGRMKRSSSLQPVAPSFGQPSATGAAVRKRKSAASMTRGRNYTPHAGGGGFAEPRTPNPQGSGSGSGGLDIGFVNFTPSDHNILMTGVAPSGSSKTKARREKEAAEKQRKMSEAFLKAVKASGADIAKLQEEGIVM